MGGGPAFDRNADPSTYQINSTMSTVFSLLNSMIGGTMLFLPLYFNSTGFISSTVVMVIMSLISYKTCDVYIQHMKKSEFDIQEILGRIMGNRWRLFFIVISSIYMILVTLLYYSFSIEMIFNITTFIMQQCGYNNFASKSTQTFSEFSIQYTTLITIPIFLGLLFLRDLKFMIKIAELGVYAIYSYVVFIFYCFISNLTSGTLQDNISSIPIWTFDIGQLASTASLAFQIHTNACPMIKCHRDQPHNRRAIKITYIIGTIIYMMIGLIGGLGVVGRVSFTGKTAQNINDFFSTDAWQPLIVEVLYLIHLVSMFPILYDIGRTRVYQVVFAKNEGKPPQIVFVLSNVFLIAICSIFKIVGVSPNTLVDINGSFSCFFIVYLFPSLLHLACYHGSNQFLRSMKGVASIMIENKQRIEDGESSNESKSNADSVSLIEEDQEKEFKGEVQNLRTPRLESCNNHTEDIQSIPKSVRVATYTGIMVLGVIIFIYGMYSVIDNAINGDS